jgi:hypothetical protein
MVIQKDPYTNYVSEGLHRAIRKDPYTESFRKIHTRGDSERYIHRVI